MRSRTRQCILVLGMHRSGTSALAGSLAILGAALPKRVAGPRFDNPKGFFEPLSIILIHDRLLAAAGTNWSAFDAIPREWFASQDAVRYVDELVEAVAIDYADAPLFVVKDPRICRIVPLWRDVLAHVGAEPRVAITVRHPIAVARSVERRDGLSQEHACLSWMRHLLEAERETRDCRRVFLHFEDLLRQPSGIAADAASVLLDGWTALNEQMACRIEKLIDPSLRHETAAAGDVCGSADLRPLLDTAYQAADALVRSPHDAGAQATLDAVRAAFDPLVSSFSRILVPGLTAAGARGPLDRHEQRRLIVESGLFDQHWYLARNPDVAAAGMDPLTHYLLHGAAEGRDPNPLFDSDWYLHRYPDVRVAEINPLAHYVQFGAAAGHDPSASFSTRDYVGSCSDIAAGKVNPLAHYLARGCLRGNDHGREFRGDGNPPSIARHTTPADVAPSSNDGLGQYLAEYRHRQNVANGERDPAYVGLATSDVVPPSHTLKPIAFYLPQMHPIPENDRAWGQGFTEWTNVCKAVPQFSGHYQPKLPGELGFYDLRIPDVMRRQIELAKLYGLYGFCFHYYWFDGLRPLKRPLDMFLTDRSMDFNFCLCWANENWTKAWDGGDGDVLVAQRHSPEDYRSMFEDMLRYVRDERYIRIDGRPLIAIYRPDIVPDLDRLIKTWRCEARQAGLPDVFVMATNSFGFGQAQEFGFDAMCEFPPHGLGVGAVDTTGLRLNSDFAGLIHRYEEVVTTECAKLRSLTGDTFRFPGVMPAWDNEARRPGRGKVFHGSTPALFRDWLNAAACYVTDTHAADRRFVFINAWNEWAEGAYLEPDRRFGYAYLASVREVVENFAARDVPHHSKVMLRREFEAYFDSLITRVRNVDIAHHEQALRSAFAHIAQSVDASNLLQFTAEHFAISPFIPPDRGDVIYVKINHGFWEELYWLFGGKYDPERMRVQDASQHREVYVASGFLAALRDLMDRVIVAEDDGLGFSGISFGINLSGGGVDHATVLSRFSSVPDNRVIIGAAIGAASYFHALRGKRRVKFCEGSFPKSGIRTGELRSCLRKFAERSARIIFVVPPHLRGIRLDGVERPQETIIISEKHVHESWAASLFTTVGHILDTLETVDAIMVLAQSAVFSVMLGLFLKEAKDAMLPASKRLYFFDLGQALDVANPGGGGPWLKNNAVTGDLSLFRLVEE